MSYTHQNGQELESAYTYTAKDGSCKFSKSKAKVHASNVTHVKSQSVSQLKAAIAKSPTAVSVEADKDAFRHYSSGVMNSKSCGTSTNHAIAAVGYGTAGSQDYYIVRNSWGSGWGEKGYIRIAAVDGIGICAIQRAPAYATTD